MIKKAGKFVEDQMLTMLMARAMCRLPILFGGGHKRGKRISDTHVQCPRCGDEWARKAKNAASKV